MYSTNMQKHWRFWIIFLNYAVINKNLNHFLIWKKVSSMTSMKLCLKSGPCVTECFLHITSVSHNNLNKSSLIPWLFKIIYLSVHIVTLKRISLSFLGCSMLLLCITQWSTCFQSHCYLSSGLLISSDGATKKLVRLMWNSCAYEIVLLDCLIGFLVILSK